MTMNLGEFFKKNKHWRFFIQEDAAHLHGAMTFDSCYAGAPGDFPRCRGSKN